MPPRSKFVEPQAPDPRKHAERILIDGGWNAGEVDWLVPALFRTLDSEGPAGDAETLLSGRASHIFQELAKAKHQLGTTEAVFVFATYVVERELCDPPPASQWDLLLSEARERGIPLMSGLGQLHRLSLGEPVPALLLTWKNLGPWELGFRLRALAERLIRAGVGDFPAFVCWSLRHDPEDRAAWGPMSWPTELRTASLVDPSGISFWLHALGENAIAPLVSRVIAASPTDFVERATALVWALSNWMTSPKPAGLQLAYFDYLALPPQAREGVERLYFAAQDRLGSDAKASSSSAPLLLHLARMAFEGRSEHLQEDNRKTLLRLASDSLSRQRPLLRQAHTPEAISQFSSHPTASLRNDAVFMLFEFGTLWEAWKPLLLAFRSLSAPALSTELSFSENAPHPWSIIPSSIVMMFHHRARREQEGDPTLKALRSEFGQFCLDSLKTVKQRRTKEGPVGREVDAAQLREPSADWRYGYIRAVLELRTNPEGDGHKVLRWVADNDPDEEVKEAANKAYNEVRRGDRLGDMSPRRAILQAFWWLEQAHMLALGQSVDGPGAQRTREWMVRMTTEKSSSERQET